MNVKDRRDLQGVTALGAPNAILNFKSALQNELEDVLIRIWSVSVDGIYKGRIVNRDENNVYVDLGGTIGVLPKNEDPGTDQVVVQVERRRIGGKTPFLTTEIKFIGEYAILVPGGKIGVSLKIQDVNKRLELTALGESLQVDGWGIIWREAAALKSKEVLEMEVSRLNEKARILSERISSASAPALLIEGLRFADAEFPASSKHALDMLRSTVTPTLEGHHFYKSCGGSVSAALEMAEQLLEKGQSRDEVQRLFRGYVESGFPTIGFSVYVEHVKPSGAIFNLGQATIEALNADGMRYSRTMRADGVYDGLGVEKKKGDMAVSEVKFGEWYIVTSYFSSDGVWKGAYVNINTPVELYPKAIRYVDLEVDVCVRPDGAVRLLDMEKLEKAYNRGIIGDKLMGRVKETLSTVTGEDFIQKLLAKFI